MNPVVMIYTREPDSSIVGAVEDLLEEGMRILVFNDGSGWKYRQFYSYLRSCGCVVLSNAMPKGKGSCLHQAMDYLLEEGETLLVETDQKHLLSAEALQTVLAECSSESLSIVNPGFSLKGIPSSLKLFLKSGKYCPDVNGCIKCWPSDLFLSVQDVQDENEEQTVLEAVKQKGLKIILLPSVHSMSLHTGNAVR